MSKYRKVINLLQDPLNERIPYDLTITGINYSDIPEAYRKGRYGIDCQIDNIPGCYTEDGEKWYSVHDSRKNIIVAIIVKIDYCSKVTPRYEPYIVFTPICRPCATLKDELEVVCYTKWNCYRPIYANSPKTLQECIDKVTNINGEYL